MFFLPSTLRAFRFLILCFVLFVVVVSSSSRVSNVCLDGGRLLQRGVPKESVVASKAYLSATVFLGTLYRMVEAPDGTIRAAFGVGKLLKSDDTVMPGSSQVEILYFQRKRSGKECILPVKSEELTLGSEYIVFGHHEERFGIVGTAFPEELTKKTWRQVTKVLCENCAKKAGIEGLPDNIELNEQQKLSLQCRLKGNPIPWVQWFKDGKEIEGDGRLKVKTKRRSSKVVIRHVRRQDSGVYECRAGNVVDEKSAFAKAVVTITAKNTTTKPKTETNSTAPTLWPVEPCPVQDFCLNGGKCTFYSEFEEHICECAEGYVGLRCHYKNVRVSLSKVRRMARDSGHLFVNVVVIYSVLFCIKWACQLVCSFYWVRRYNPGIKSFRRDV